jgi:hypothetical protein
MSTIPQDRSPLCTVTFADGRHCRTPRSPRHLYLRTFHARKEAQAQAGQQVGLDLATHFSGNYLSACGLSSALGHLMSAVAQGHLKPKTAITLAYLSRTLLQSIHLSQHEYINAFGTDSWREEIRSSFAPPSPTPTEEPAHPKSQNPHFEPLPPNPATYVESILAKLYQNK